MGRIQCRRERASAKVSWTERDARRDPAADLAGNTVKASSAGSLSLHARKRRRRQIRTGIGWLAAIYVLGVLGLVGYIYWQRFVADNLRRHIQEQTPTVTAIQGTAERWRQIEWAVNPKLYPVELLYQISGLLPHDGLRLTAIEIQNGKVVIRGEASTAPAAFKFAEDIKAKPELQMFNWQMPSPILRPDGRAEFTIEGDPKFAKIN